MKKITKFLALAALLLSTSCSDILDEQPRSFYTPEFFSTEEGIQGGLTSLYAHLRYIYGQGYYYNIMTTGTDEATYAQSADSNFKDADLSGVGNLTASTSRSDVLWGTAFSNINTCSGIIENATKAGMSASLIAEARFFRAFDYFKLVQTFGGVPLDMGAGELKFNTTPARTSVRNTVPEVYTKAIFPDLILAVQDLPETGRVTGGVTKTLARLYLSKAYLTYAWWLENPKNKPTYPEAGRQDPDGKTAAQYFQMAYDIAVEAIENPGPFGLAPTYYDAHVATNDRNNEILLYADHTQDSEFYNASSLSWSNGNAPENFSYWMINWNYQTLKIKDANGATFEPIGRDALQGYGRPWTRMAPTHEALATFTDKSMDSRFNVTFTTAYRANWDRAGKPDAVAYAANGIAVQSGDVILTFLGEEYDGEVAYPSDAGVSNVGAGVIAGRADFVIEPHAVSRVCYPGPWKISGHRTDTGTGLGSPNGASTRPYTINKFSELYFVAAEAAVKGATAKSGKSARELLNVIRARAGKWSFDVAANQSVELDYSDELVAATPQTITIDYILDERMREFYGEGARWFELVRTQTWQERAGSYTICGSAWNDKTPVTYNRSIEDYHYLRPIPQGQLDGMEMTEEEKAAYQNPSYQ
ncbi:MAG: RagB/SusD family nutrient uptake outer membrane protein [Rikenellaceae bacterium]|nr:RagB/SusD family nutrient uptake outer membrane protein [Rikenellaceae bacterium]